MRVSLRSRNLATGRQGRAHSFSPVIETPNERRRYRLRGFCSSSEGGASGNFSPAASLKQAPCQHYKFLFLRGFLYFSAKTAAAGVFQSRHALMACMKANSLSAPWYFERSAPTADVRSQSSTKTSRL